MNKHVINCLISRPLHQSYRFKTTTTADLVAVDNAVYLFYDIFYACLYAAGVYLGLFGKFHEGRPPFFVPDPLLVSAVSGDTNGRGKNYPDLIGLGRNDLGDGHNGFGENNPGLVVPNLLSVFSVSAGNNGLGRNNPSLGGAW